MSSRSLEKESHQLCVSVTLRIYACLQGEVQVVLHVFSCMAVLCAEKFWRFSDRDRPRSVNRHRKVIQGEGHGLNVQVTVSGYHHGIQESFLLKTYSVKK